MWWQGHFCGEICGSGCVDGGSLNIGNNFSLFEAFGLAFSLFQAGWCEGMVQAKILMKVEINERRLPLFPH